MSGAYLTDLADWFREVGLVVVEYPGWQTRAKSSGGYADRSRPWGVMWHHSASSPNTKPEDLARYTAETGDNAPIANVNVERDGAVWVLAAGPTNTNGKGGPVRWSKGLVPVDSMNSYAFGMEISNNGVGEPYPQVQIDAAFVVSNTINARLGNAPTDVCTHWGWAPSRKIDPATSESVQGPWRPHSCSSSGTWELADLIIECSARAGRAPTPKGDDVAVSIMQCTDADAAFVGVTSDEVGVHISWADASMAARYRAIPTVKQQDVSVDQLQSMVLLGRLPENDSRHHWTGSEFADVVT
jgi:hypothetical protein